MDRYSDVNELVNGIFMRNLQYERERERKREREREREGRCGVLVADGRFCCRLAAANPRKLEAFLVLGKELSRH